MRYEILGPLRVTEGGESSYITARKVQTVFAVLLIRAGDIVPAEQLIAEIWGTAAPRTALAALHVYVSDLRKFLARPHRLLSPIVTRNPGYVLGLGSDELDA